MYSVSVDATAPLHVDILEMIPKISGGFEVKVIDKSENEDTYINSVEIEIKGKYQWTEMVILPHDMQD